MAQSTDFMDVADSDFLGSKELDDDSSGSDSEFEKYIAFSSAGNRLFGRKRPLRVVLGSGKCMLFCFFHIPFFSLCMKYFACFIRHDQFYIGSLRTFGAVN